MKILVVTPWFPTAKKPGAAPFMLHDAELLQRSSEVTVIHLANPDDLAADDSHRTRAPSGILVIRQPFVPLDPVSVVRAVTLIRRWVRRADVVHTMALHALLPVRLARPTIPWVHTEHWSGMMRTPASWKKRLGRAAYLSSLAKPDAVVAVGESLARSVSRYTSAPVKVVSNHVVLGSVDGGPETPESRGGAPLRLVAVGNLIHHKGPLLALDALKELHERGIPATLTWVGRGPLEAEMTERAVEMGLGSSLVMVGQVPHAQIAALLQAAHVFVLPTASETFGVAFAEALGQGLPVVATGEGGHLDFLPPKGSRIVAKRTGSAIAEAINSLITDSERWTPKQILAYADAQFSERQREAAYSAVYAELSPPMPRRTER